MFCHQNTPASPASNENGCKAYVSTVPQMWRKQATWSVWVQCDRQTAYWNIWCTIELLEALVFGYLVIWHFEEFSTDLFSGKQLLNLIYIFITCTSYLCRYTFTRKTTGKRMAPWYCNRPTKGKLRWWLWALRMNSNRSW